MTFGADLFSMLHSLGKSKDSRRQRVLDTFQSPWAETFRGEVEPQFYISKSFTNIPEVFQSDFTTPCFNSIQRDQ